MQRLCLRSGGGVAICPSVPVLVLEQAADPIHRRPHRVMPPERPGVPMLHPPFGVGIRL
jgi:hypothetical protein